MRSYKTKIQELKVLLSYLKLSNNMSYDRVINNKVFNKFTEFKEFSQNIPIFPNNFNMYHKKVVFWHRKYEILVIAVFSMLEHHNNSKFMPTKTQLIIQKIFNPLAIDVQENIRFLFLGSFCKYD